MKCPACGNPLEGLGSYCWTCEGYVADLQKPKPTEGTPAPEAPKRKDERSEKEIQHGIKQVLQAHGFAVWDTSQPFAAKITPGLPDLFATGRGLCLWIECKSAKGRQTDEQMYFQKTVQKNGGLYLIARHEEDVMGFIDRQLKRTA